MVTGGGGYVGSHAVRALFADGHRVVIYDNFTTGHRWLCEGFVVVEGDIKDAELVKRCITDHRIEAVMHFAASAYVGESVVNPRKYFNNNVESALKLLDVILESPVRQFIFSSTCATYGEPHKLPIDENTCQNPINPYGASKLFLEHVLAAYSVSHGLQYVTLRYFNAAGAHPTAPIGECHDPETHLIPLALGAIIGTRPPLDIYGHNLPTPDGTCVRDFVHVCDLGRAHVKALNYLSTGGAPVVLNLGTGRGTSISELLAAIRRVTGKIVPHRFVSERLGDPVSLFADSTKAMNILEWSTTFDLEEIVSTAWAWEQKLTSR